MARHVSRPGVAGAAGTIAGAVMGVLSACGAGAAEPAVATGSELKFTTKGSSAYVYAGERLVLEYCIQGPFKPYIKQLFTPAGVNVLLDAPSDHLHHHGVMLALKADGVDFWSETPTNGKQMMTSVTRGDFRAVDPGATRAWAERSADGKSTVVQTRPVPARPAGAGFVTKLDWLGPDGKCRLKEERTVEVVCSSDPNATLLTWRSVLSCPTGVESVKLTGDHYFGLGMRFVRSMDKVAVFRNAEGAPDKTGVHVRGSEYVAPSAWCAVAGPVEGKQIAAAMFGHPDCTRFPVHWFTMTDGFAYLAATANLWKQPLTIEKDKPLELWYGVAVWDGTADNARVEKLRGEWVKWCGGKTDKP